MRPASRGRRAAVAIAPRGGAGAPPSPNLLSPAAGQCECKVDARMRIHVFGSILYAFLETWDGASMEQYNKYLSDLVQSNVICARRRVCICTVRVVRCAPCKCMCICTNTSACAGVHEVMTSTACRMSVVHHTRLASARGVRLARCQMGRSWCGGSAALNTTAPAGSQKVQLPWRAR